jgi:cytochrome c biogenesis protein CcmG/thiol:disulfide interchange protein DsbE
MIGFLVRNGLGFVFVLVPVIGLLGIMAWGLLQADGNPGSFGINKIFGEVPVEEYTAPPISLELLNGQKLELAEFKGKIVMVDFWSSWCPPCIEEAPVLASVYTEYVSEGVEFIGVAIWDDYQEVQSYVNRAGFTYHNGIDLRGVVAISYGVRGLPEKYFIDRSGVLVRKFIGPVTEDKLRTILDELIENEQR